jgi:hypothetical protein
LQTLNNALYLLNNSQPPQNGGCQTSSLYLPSQSPSSNGYNLQTEQATRARNSTQYVSNTEHYNLPAQYNASNQTYSWQDEVKLKLQYLYNLPDGQQVPDEKILRQLSVAPQLAATRNVLRTTNVKQPISITPQTNNKVQQPEAMPQTTNVQHQPMTICLPRLTRHTISKIFQH